MIYCCGCDAASCCCVCWYCVGRRRGYHSSAISPLESSICLSINDVGLYGKSHSLLTRMILIYFSWYAGCFVRLDQPAISACLVLRSGSKRRQYAHFGHMIYNILHTTMLLLLLLFLLYTKSRRFRANR